MLTSYFKKEIGVIIFFFSFITLLIGFFFNEDGTGFALSGDFRDTLPYVLELKKNIFIDPTPWTLHFPLHYILFAKVDLIFNNIYFTRFIFCFFSFLVPVLFYYCLKFRFKNCNKNILLILSSIIFFTPGFRYSAIWANDHIFGFIFFLLSIFFFYKWSDDSVIIKKRNFFYTFLNIFFLAICCYSRQYYVVFFFIFLYIYFRDLDLKQFILILLFSFFLSMPGLFILYKFPGLFTQLSFTNNLYNNIYGNFSAMLVYVFPIFFLNILKKNNENINLKKIIFLLSLSVFLFFVFMKKLDYDRTLSLGSFFVISKYIFGNYLLFHFTVILGFLLTMILIQNRIDFVVVFIIIFTFSGSVVIQKYFEPLFYFVFFLLMKSNFKNIFLKNQNITFLLLFFYIFYYFVTISDILYKFKFSV
jgi:hypothetical protein